MSLQSRPVFLSVHACVFCVCHFNSYYLIHACIDPILYHSRQNSGWRRSSFAATPPSLLPSQQNAAGVGGAHHPLLLPSEAFSLAGRQASDSHLSIHSGFGGGVSQPVSRSSLSRQSSLPLSSSHSQATASPRDGSCTTSASVMNSKTAQHNSG